MINRMESVHCIFLTLWYFLFTVSCFLLFKHSEISVSTLLGHKWLLIFLSKAWILTVVRLIYSETQVKVLGEELKMISVRSSKNRLQIKTFRWCWVSSVFSSKHVYTSVLRTHESISKFVYHGEFGQHGFP